MHSLISEVGTYVAIIGCILIVPGVLFGSMWLVSWSDEQDKKSFPTTIIAEGVLTDAKLTNRGWQLTFGEKTVKVPECYQSFETGKTYRVCSNYEGIHVEPVEGMSC